MVEVEPAVLVAGSTAIAVLLGVVVCMSSRDKTQKKTTKQDEEVSKKETKVAVSKTKKNKEKKSDKKFVEKKVDNVQHVAEKKVESVPAPPVPQENPVTVDEDAPKKRKKAKETPEQRAARLERQKIAKQKKADEAAAAVASKNVENVATSNYVSESIPFQQPQGSDGWAVVEDRRSKKKSKPVEVKVSEKSIDEEPILQPVSTDVSEIVMVDSKKIGGVIGPKGATLHAIQDKTDVTINTPKDRNGSEVPVTVTGPAEGVAAAVKIIKDLNTKGYSKSLEGDNFNESAVNVKSSKLSDLIGKNGACIRAIQDKTGVKISIPPHSENKTKVRVGLAGTPDAINETKVIINDIMTYYHSDITHPGVIHEEMDVPERMYNMIIGARGSEIKHIQNNYKVSVYIPNDNSVIKKVLVVGQKNAVEGAVKYIEKIVSNLNEEEAKVMSIAEDWNEQQAIEENDEPWMSQYNYDKDQKHSLISKEGADLLERAQASAWKDCTSAEGW